MDNQVQGGDTFLDMGATVSHSPHCETETHHTRMDVCLVFLLDTLAMILVEGFSTLLEAKFDGAKLTDIQQRTRLWTHLDEELHLVGVEVLQLVLVAVHHLGASVRLHLHVNQVPELHSLYRQSVHKVSHAVCSRSVRMLSQVRFESCVVSSRHASIV